MKYIIESYERRRRDIMKDLNVMKGTDFKDTEPWIRLKSEWMTLGRIIEDLKKVYT